jgi:alcohol dehydrogenase
MRAASISGHGDLDRLTVGAWPDPEPQEGQVVVGVSACGLNHLDVFVLKGMPGLPVQMPRIPGGDIAGTVLEVGDGVSPTWKGKRVLLDPLIEIHGKPGALGEHANGGSCERIAIGEANLIPLPDTVSFEEAAALPIAYGTAQRMMVDRGGIQAGELVLILGASGGVGTACVQIAKALGCTVIACASTDEKLERLAQLGADHLVNYATEDFSRQAWAISGKRGVDVVVNFTGGNTWVPSLRALTVFGRLLTCGATAGAHPETDIRYIWRRQASIIGSDGWSRANLVHLVEQVAERRIKPVIDRVVPLDDIRDGFRALMSREVFGKVIVKP